jgi:hypothetical protein
MRAWPFSSATILSISLLGTATEARTTLRERSRSNYSSRASLSHDCFMASPYQTKPKPLAVVMRTEGGKYSHVSCRTVARSVERRANLFHEMRDGMAECFGPSRVAPIHKIREPVSFPVRKAQITAISVGLFPFI